MANSVHRLQDFANEASQAILDPTDPYVIVRSTAVDGDNRPRGRRSIILHQRYFQDADVIWHVTANLWADQFDSATMELFHSPSPPQLQDEAVHWRRVNTVPMMVSYYMLPDDISSSVRLGSYALQMPTTTNYESIFAGIPRHDRAELTVEDGTIWCKNHYCPMDAALTIEEGTHVLVYPLSLEIPDYDMEENEEESVQTQDEELRDETLEDSSTSVRNKRSTWWLGLYCVPFSVGALF